MASKAVFVFCAQVLLIQYVYTQCPNAFGYPGAFSGYAPALAYDSMPAFAGRLAYDGCYAAASPALDFSPTSGGGLPVSSASGVAPVGISVLSENAYEGVLAVAGELPFVGTTGFEGVVPSAGYGAINHACGNGVNAMSALSDSSSPASVSSALSGPYGKATFGAPAYANAAYGPAYAASGYRAPALAAPALAAPAFAAKSLAYDAPCNAALGYADGIEYTATSGGALPVSSASAVPPTGIAVASETAYEGPLVVAGELPFVGTVGLEGVLPTTGAGAVNHACGNGRNAMVSDSEAFAPAFGAYGAYAPAAALTPAASYASGLAAPALGYRAGFAGRGCAF